MTGSALLAQLVEHLHGKEGVDGSSPSEGSAKAPQGGAFSFRPSSAFLSVGVHGKRCGKSSLRSPSHAGLRGERALENRAMVGGIHANGPATLVRPGPGTGKELRCEASVCKASRRSRSRSTCFERQVSRCTRRRSRSACWSRAA